jgi:putative hydrolase of the HAD superfamily
MPHFPALPFDVDVVLFDAVGTLLIAEPDVVAVYRQAAEEFGLDLNRAEVEFRFRRALSKQDLIDSRELKCRTDEVREMERWRAIVAEVFPEIDGKDCFSMLWNHFARPESWRLEPSVLEFWHELRHRGVSLGIASNFDARLRTICDAKVELGTAYQLFVSSKVGWRKPAKQFFQSIAAELGVPPARILLVGDDRQNDIAAARAAGWQASTPADLFRRE